MYRLLLIMSLLLVLLTVSGSAPPVNSTDVRPATITITSLLPDQEVTFDYAFIGMNEGWDEPGAVRGMFAREEKRALITPFEMTSNWETFILLVKEVGTEGGLQVKSAYVPGGYVLTEKATVMLHLNIGGNLMPAAEL